MLDTHFLLWVRSFKYRANRGVRRRPNGRLHPVLGLEPHCPHLALRDCWSIPRAQIGLKIVLAFHGPEEAISRRAMALTGKQETVQPLVSPNTRNLPQHGENFRLGPVWRAFCSSWLEPPFTYSRLELDCSKSVYNITQSFEFVKTFCHFYHLFILSYIWMPILIFIMSMFTNIYYVFIYYYIINMFFISYICLQECYLIFAILSLSIDICIKLCYDTLVRMKKRKLTRLDKALITNFQFAI